MASKSRSVLSVIVFVQVLSLVFSESHKSNELLEDKEAPPAIPVPLQGLLTDDLASWGAPLNLQTNFVYYLSGFDEDKRPVWVLEVGKWDVRSQVEGGDYNEYDKYVRQAVFRLLNSTQITSTKEHRVSQVNLILDFEDFDMTQISSVKTVSYVLKSFRTFLPAFEKMHVAYCINTNFVAHSVINMVKPIMGRDFDRVEVYGTNKSKWMPSLLKHIPKDQLPEWYGGAKAFKPKAVYGR